MNALTYALNNLKYVIPPEILNIAFKEPYESLNSIYTIDEMLLSKVIRPRILVDANIVGGVQLVINLDKCQITSYDNLTYVVTVPKTLTNNRSIISLLSIVTLPGSSSSNSMYGMMDTSPLSNMQSNLSSLGVIQTSRLEMIGDNVFIMQTPNANLSNTLVRCNVANSDNLENIHPRNHIAFAKLVALGVRSYIYNTTIIKLDKGFVYGGHELPIIKDIIEGYSDYEELYQEHLNNKWKKISFMNNKEAMHRHITSMIGNNI